MIKVKDKTFANYHEYFDFVAATLGYPPFHRYFEYDSIMSDRIRLHLDVIEQNPDSPTIVFIPGTAVYSLCYAEILFKISEAGYNIVGFDPRGHGRSEGERGDYTINELMIDAKNVISYAIKRFNKKVTLMGSSQGGIVALYMAASDPRLDAVICQNFADLTSPESTSLTKHPRLFKYLRMLMGPAGELLPNAQVPVAAYIDLDKIPVKGFGTIRNFIEQDPLTIKTVSLRALRSLGSTELPIPLAKIKTPVMVFQGDADSIFAVDYTKKIFEQIGAKKRMKVFTDMSHALMSENATEILPEILNWLSEVYSTAEAVQAPTANVLKT